MDSSILEQRSEYEWLLPKSGRMRVPGIFFADRKLISGIEEKTVQQVKNVASLPGIVKASYAMPDAHQGYGFPIGGVAAFDPKQGGVISAGGVGFDIACGVRTLTTGLVFDDIRGIREKLADLLFTAIPSGVGSTGRLRLDNAEIDQMLVNGASWAVGRGYGLPRDLARTEENGKVNGADPGQVSDTAKKRIRDQLGSLGSGNHYLEIQKVEEIYDAEKADAYCLNRDDILVTIHCGSRGLGHQIGKDYLRLMLDQAPKHGLELPDRELACAPIHSKLGQSYIGAMLCGINCALANRQVLTHQVREAFSALLPEAQLNLLFDVSHNTCKVERHRIGGRDKSLFVHRKGATRSLGPGHPDIPADIRHAGQPVLVGGTMGTASYILAGAETALEKSFASACHGAGRALSRAQSKKLHKGADIVNKLMHRGILVRSGSMKGLAEEAPDAYKDVDRVVKSACGAGLADMVARLSPVVCVKG